MSEANDTRGESERAREILIRERADVGTARGPTSSEQSKPIKGGNRRVCCCCAAAMANCCKWPFFVVARARRGGRGEMTV